MIHKIILSKPKRNKKNKVLFLDKDGGVNKKPPKHDYVKTWSEFKFNPKIFDFVRKANLKNYLVIIITNQRGIARNIISESGFKEITKNMNREIVKNNGELSAVYYCPHDYYELCVCRKPKAGLILGAIEDFNIDVSRSIMIGDSDSDIQAARKAKLKKVIKIKTDDLSKLDKLL